MALSIEFWLGTALAIPLGVAAGAIGHYAEPLLDAVSKTFALRQSQLTKAEYQRTKDFVANSSSMNSYLISLVLKALLLAPIGQVWSEIRNIVNTYITNGFGALANVMALLDHVITIGTAMVIFVIVRRGISAYSRVANFPEYERKVLVKLGPIPGARDQPMPAPVPESR